MSDVYLHVQNNAQGVQLATLHEKLVWNRQVLVAEGIVSTVSTQRLVIKMANWSSRQILAPKQMKVAACSTAPASRVYPQETATQKKGLTPEDIENATQFYKATESKKQIIERPHQVKKKNANIVEKQSTKTM